MKTCFSFRTLMLRAALIASSLATITLALASPYNNPGPFILPVPALPGLPTPAQVSGKAYSDESDHNTMPAAGNFDAGQLIAWDGLGGTADGDDLSPIGETNHQIDAIASQFDALFQEVLDDSAHLIFSVDDSAYSTMEFGLQPRGTPVSGELTVPDTIQGGEEQIASSGGLSYELGRFGAAHPSNVRGIWASRIQIDQTLPAQNIDAIELWGPEPGPGPSDITKYSITNDISSAVAASIPYAVRNAPGESGYVPLQMVADLVVHLLDIEGSIDLAQIDLDALMVLNKTGSPNVFESGDRILFSIRQIPFASALDGSGFLATGSEIFWLDGASTAAVPVGGFLFHGGHMWDKQYALANMTAMVATITSPVRVQLDLDALEAVAGVPEPIGPVLLMIGAIAALSCRQLGARDRALTSS